MPPNKTTNHGRQLLITKSRLRTEKDSLKIALLKRKEASLLLELGRRPEALLVATALSKSNPSNSSHRAFLADILCRMSKWRLAEEIFTEVYQLCLVNSKKDKAFSIAAGPLFLLAEAREDYERCLEIAPLPILKNRAERLMGNKVVDREAPESEPWNQIAKLEKVHLGGNPHILPTLLKDWKLGEAEWYWRILFEATNLAVINGMSLKPWRKQLKQLHTVVLDPRYFIERRDLKKVLR